LRVRVDAAEVDIAGGMTIVTAAAKVAVGTAFRIIIVADREPVVRPCPKC
jgi:hypothetical protein